MSFGCTDTIRGFHLLLGEVSPPQLASSCPGLGPVEVGSIIECRHHLGAAKPLHDSQLL